MNQVFSEVTPLTPYDCFTLFRRKKTEFDFPVHYHDEFELNFIMNGKGVKRIIGDHAEEIDDIELVLVGSNLPHGWLNHNYQYETGDEEITEITIQFHKDLFEESFLKRNQLFFLKNLLDRSSRGILFSRETILSIKPRLEALSVKTGLESVLELISILHDLSVSRQMRLLSDATFAGGQVTYNSRRIENVFEYMRSYYHKDISLADVAEVAGMTEVSFSRFIRKRTGKTFIESLNDIRLGYASRKLIESSETVAEIAIKCGFHNISYFNRLFKKRKNITPREFRENYSGTRTFI